MKKNKGFIGIIIVFIVILLIIVVGILAINIISDLLGNEDILESVTSNIQIGVENFEEESEKGNNNSSVSNSSTELKNVINNISSTSNSQKSAINEISKDNSVNNAKINNPNYFYFYDQLNVWSKLIYNALYENKENMKSGTYKIEIDKSVSKLLEQENGVDLLQDYYQSAVEAFIYDNVDVFYIDVNKLFINIETTKKIFSTTYNVFIDNGSSTSYLIEEFSSKDQIDRAIQMVEIEAQKIISNHIGNNYERIIGIHDYLIDNLSYDRTISKPHIYNIYGALVNKECVCEGYAKAYKYLLNKIGIDVILIIGDATNSEGRVESHAWDYLKIDNKWYAVDVTWDDPILIGGGKLSKISKYKYFLKGINTMQSDHRANGQFTEDGMVFNYPELSREDYE